MKSLEGSLLIGPESFIRRGERMLSDDDVAFIRNFPATINNLAERKERWLRDPEAEVLQSPAIQKINKQISDLERKAKQSKQDRQELLDEIYALQREKFNLVMDLTGKVRQEIELADREITERLESIRQKLIASSPLTKQQAQELVYQRVSIAPDATYDYPKIWEDYADFIQLTGGAGLEKQVRVSVEEGRAGSRWDGFIRVSPNDRRALFHEAAHQLEYYDIRARFSAQDWVRSRATSKEAVKLSVLTGNSRYKDDEVALPDKFISPYVGKQYETGATEVISTGFERLSSAEAMRELAEDPDHFFFTLGVLRR